MAKYRIGLMTNVLEIEVNSIDEAICMGLLIFNTNAPIAVYDCLEKSNMEYPYDYYEVDRILDSMGCRVKESFNSYKKV